MKAQIYCRVPEGRTLTFDVGTTEADIGRETTAGVALPVEGVSRRHARLSWDGKAHWLEDLKSTNGTFLNGEVVRRERLRHLDVITLGREVDLIYVVRGEGYEPVKKQGIVAARLVPLAEDAAPHSIPVGETTLGRSDACNVIAGDGAVSKLHARIERTSSTLTLDDLGSSNGTEVNGTRIHAGAELHHGDEVCLAGVERYRVEIEMGQVAAPSGTLTDLPTPKLKDRDEEGPRFSSDWKTRVEWSTGELEELREFRQRLERSRSGAQSGPVPPEKPAPADRTALPSKMPTPKGASGKAEAPAKPGPPAKPSAAEPASPSVPGSAPGRREAPGHPPPEPAAPVAARTAPPPASPEPPVPAPPARPSMIVEVRLVAPGFDLGAREPGEHRIGRGRDVALRVDHPTVSRKHARLVLSDDRQKAFIRHDGGSNGTFHNGTRIERLEEVSDGDTVKVGDVELRVRVRRA